MNSWEYLWQNVDVRYLSEFMTHRGIGLDNKVRVCIADIINKLTEPSIIDVGCGPGIEYSSLALRVKQNFSYTGIDFADNTFIVARARAMLFGRDNYEFIKENIFNLPTPEIPAGKFDVLISKDVLEHLPPPDITQFNYINAVKHFKAMQTQHIILGFHLGLGTEGEDVITLCDDKLYRNVYTESTMLDLLSPEYSCQILETPTDTIFGARPARVIWGVRNDT